MKNRLILFSVLSALLFSISSCTENEDSFSVPVYDFVQHENLQASFNGTVNVLFYLDGDNNLNDTIFENLKILSKSYSEITDENGNQENGFCNINALVLWDGLDYKAQDYEGNPLYAGTEAEVTSDRKYSYYFPGTKLIKLKKADFSDENCYSSFENFSENLSESAGWFPSSGEMNLGDASSLSSFLSFANENYPADKTVLIIEDHGAGFSGIPEDLETARSICEDYSSYKIANEKYQLDVLYNDELRTAVENAGFTEENKLDLLILDVCNESSVENAYELKDSVKSLIASPGTIPEYGIDYSDFFKNFSEDMNIKKLGINIVQSYAEKYHSACFKDSGINNIIKNGTGITFSDLECASSLSEDTNKLVEYLLNNDEIRTHLTDSAYGLLTENFSAREKSILYYGSYSYLFDYGFLIFQLEKLSDKNNLAELKEITEKLTDDLKSIVICSWRSSSLSKTKLSKEGTYPEISKNGNWFGLTISAQANRKGKYVNQIYDDSTFLFNTDSEWKSLLQSIFPEDF